MILVFFYSENILNNLYHNREKMLQLDTPFFVLEGIDGSGKGTQIQRVIQKLEKHGKTVLMLDYPRYEQKASFHTSQYLNGKYGKNIDAKAASILYAVDRFDDAYDEEAGFIQKSQSVDFVIANRYTTSNMIHQTGKIRDAKEKKDFLDWLAEIEYESMTNNFELSAKTIADIYKHRWDIELFFKWIKQNLKIKSFLGTSINAVMTQMWIAMIYYLLLAFIKHKTKLQPSHY